MIYTCDDPRRRELVAATTWNGIDHLEVLDNAAPPGTPRQRTLLLHLLRPAAGLAADQVVIEGGVRIAPVRVLWARSADAIDAALVPEEMPGFFTALPDAANILVVRTDLAGDFSTYTLRLRRGPLDDRPPDNIDPPLSRVGFSFRVECPSEFDCIAPDAPPPALPDPPDIDYLARDYASFRRVMLDRLSLIAPAWADRNPADVGVTLVELLAYVADQLAYRQDAVATEAHLATARRRVSVRRHARLVDYRLGEGCNARAHVQIRVDPLADDSVVPILLDQGAMLLTERPNLSGRIPSAVTDAALALGGEVFGTLHPQRLFPTHDRMLFHTWGDAACGLPAGAVRATLAGHFPGLAAGDVLVFEEVLGPRTGRPEDADPAHRWPVRLTQVLAREADNSPLRDAILNAEITEIEWAADDALPFAFCLSTRTERDVPIGDVSLARGNIVLADHGLAVPAEDLPPVPMPRLARPDGSLVPPRYLPLLRQAGLTFAVPYTHPAPSARAALAARPGDARPRITLAAEEAGIPNLWTAAADLLGSPASAREFVPEAEEDGSLRLRFGDDRQGMRPQAGTRFVATYRVGNGSAGNLGADALTHVVSDDARILGARNPLAATGGTDPEPMETARRRVPHAWRSLARAVTEADYATLAARQPRVQRAAATFRWTGSWRTAFVTVDALGGAADPAMVADLRAGLEPCRLAGTDLAIDAPRFVPLELDLMVCVDPGYFRAQVRQGLLAALGPRQLFDPDRLSFAEPVRISAILAAAQAVAGVMSVEVTRLQRLGRPDRRVLETGQLDLGRLEIARLDNDRDRPENGVLRLTLGGGK
ncbi:putative baseplate assembly protein [Humitalea sp. 24SJ18S-53]|uniref:putative baseplate assembly protein n=1 Tax=Humitalea sp. 24SJ18S-53 TaxID=3422307 RepID=UPI003D679562